MTVPAAVVARLDVSRETMDSLETYVGLLLRWNKRINLIARGTEDALWTRHILDSGQLLHFAPGDARHWADLGSGGGLPALVLAILGKERRPGLRFTLVESDQRKSVFLRTAARECGVDITVLSERAESVTPLNADIVSARALAALPALLALANRHLAPGGVCIFPKGARYRDEVNEALETYAFRCEEHRSETAEDAVVLRIGDIERV